jgi:hypothetical protein
MGINFPNTPTVGQLYPQPLVAGLPVYRWDGEKWSTQGTGLSKTPIYADGSVAMSAPLTLLGDPANPTDAADKHYVDGMVPLSGGTLTGPLVLSADPAVPLGAATKQYVDSKAAQNRNRLINGQFMVDQYNNYATVTPSATGYVSDRWQVSITQPSKLSFHTIQSIGNGPAGATGIISINTVSALAPIATDVAVIQQLIEFLNIADFTFGTAAASPITLSFWIQASAAGTYSGAVLNGASSRSYVFTFNVTTASVWQKIVINIPPDGAAGSGLWISNPYVNGMFVTFDLGCGANYRTSSVGVWLNGNFKAANGGIAMVGNASAWINLSNIQLELGSVASPYDWRNDADVLAQCLRYYQVITGQSGTSNVMGQCASTTNAQILVPLAPPMRVSPNFSYSALTDWTLMSAAYTTIALASLGINSGSNAHLMLTATVASGLVGGNATMLHGSANARLYLSAEL